MYFNSLLRSGDRGANVYIFSNYNFPFFYYYSLLCILAFFIFIVYIFFLMCIYFNSLLRSGELGMRSRNLLRRHSRFAMIVSRVSPPSADPRRSRSGRLGGVETEGEGERDNRRGGGEERALLCDSEVTAP